MKESCYVHKITVLRSKWDMAFIGYRVEAKETPPDSQKFEGEEIEVFRINMPFEVAFDLISVLSGHHTNYLLSQSPSKKKKSSKLLNN